MVSNFHMPKDLRPKSWRLMDGEDDEGEDKEEEVAGEGGRRWVGWIRK